MQIPKPNALDEDHVIEEELKQIQIRRAIAFPFGNRIQADSAGTEAGIAESHGSAAQQSLIGLALSGGGVRSGALGLGVLQAFIERDFLPYVDYLSTVSGGGYAGSFLSSYAMQEGREANVVGKSDSGIATQSLGKQPNRILQLVFSVDYLRHVGSFLNRSLIGSLQMIVVGLSGLIFMTALIAWLFQWVNAQECRFALGVLGFRDDILVAFLPPVFLLSVWGMLWAVDYFRRGRRANGQFARWFLYLGAITSVTSIALLMGTGDIHLDIIPKWLGFDIDGIQPRHWTRPLLAAMTGAVIASLLPYLKPALLIRSGTNPRSTAERASFWIATRALVLGLPLLLIGWFAQENLSRKNSQRVHVLKVPNEIDRWGEWRADAPFLQRLEAEPLKSLFDGLCYTSVDNISKLDASTVPSSILTEFQSDAFSSIAAPFDEILSADFTAKATCRDVIRALQCELHEEVSKFEQLMPDHSFTYAWASLISWPLDQWARPKNPKSNTPAGLPPNGTKYKKEWRELGENLGSNSYWELVARRHRIYAIKLALLEPINCALRAHNFHELVQKAYREKEVPLPEEVAKLCASAKMQAESFANSEQLTKVGRLKQVVETNRKILQALVSGDLHEPSIIFSNYVWHDDQNLRIQIAMAALVIFLLSGFLVDLNVSSIHRYYTQRLSEAWIEPVEGLGKTIPLALMDTTSRGYPFHLLTGSVYMIGKRNRQDYPEPFDYFIFSQKFCGSERTSFARTKDFMGGKYALEDAMAISGAAVSVLHLTKNPLLTAILFALNFRLGQWLENPGHHPSIWLNRMWSKLPISPLRVLTSLSQTAEERDLCFVADGGFFDNLGIDPLLRRRCRVVFAIDAGADPNAEFTDFVRLIRYARMKHGINIQAVNGQGLPFEELSLNKKTRLAKEHFFVAEIIYPDVTTHRSWLVYVKSTMTGDECDELKRYMRSNPDFPNDSTADQAFLPGKFESYRMLGHHMAESTLNQLGLTDGGLSNRDGTTKTIIDKIDETLASEFGADQVSVTAKPGLDQLLEWLDSDDQEESSFALKALSSFQPNSADDVLKLVVLAASPADSEVASAKQSEVAEISLRYNVSTILEYMPRILLAGNLRDVHLCLGCLRDLLRFESLPTDLTLALIKVARNSSKQYPTSISRKAAQLLTKYKGSFEFTIDELRSIVGEEKKSQE